MNVSIIGRMTRQHLEEATFAELWTNATAEGAAVTHPHLRECAECRLRFASFTSWLDELRIGAITEAEQAIPADRLAAQHAQILRRLEAGERPARVIAFPKKRLETQQPISNTRWMAGVAAAAFIAGIGLGQMFNLPLTAPPDRVVESQPADLSGIVPVAAAFNHEAAMEELEAASTPRYEALRAYETFTPRVVDAVRSSR